MRLLLVEDDPLIGDGIKAGLVRQGFAVDWFSDGLEGHEAAGAAEYDAVILDLSLPGMDGLDVLRSWRARGNDVPVLILTARGDMAQRVEGLNLGADDYLGKPFALLELVARLRALVRRSHGQAASLLRYGTVVFDQESRQFTLEGREVTLSPRESMLAELFLLNRGVVLSRTRIEEKMYTWGEEISSNAVEVYVHNIRRKLGADFIRTVHGAGYALGDPGEY